MKSIRKTWFLAGIVLAVFSCSGCKKIQSSSPEDGYNTDVAMSAVEYSIFLSKQISVVENTLMTRMSMADSIANGTYEYAKEIQSTEEAISKVSAVKDELTVTMPAQSLDTDRQNVLDLTEDSLNALNTYLNNLNSKNMEGIKSSAVEMKNCMVSLSGEANTYYQ